MAAVLIDGTSRRPAVIGAVGGPTHRADRQRSFVPASVEAALRDSGLDAIGRHMQAIVTLRRALERATCMTLLAITVNGRPISAKVEPRNNIWPDFIRGNLCCWTGTHHRLRARCLRRPAPCLLNDEPIRSCGINYAALCDGASIRNDREGLAERRRHHRPCAPLYHSPEHAAAMRLLARRECWSPPATSSCDYQAPTTTKFAWNYAGNLCRCTGYNGIVKAIRRVLDAGDHRTNRPYLKPVSTAPPIAATPSAPRRPPRVPVLATGNADRPAHSRQVWAARFRTPRSRCRCVPGATITAAENGRIEGEMLASLGPINARFAGQATIAFDQATHQGQIAGEGHDKSSGTRLSGETAFAVTPDGDNATLIRLDITYRAARPPGAWSSRGPIVKVFAAEIASTVARNLENPAARRPHATHVAPLRTGHACSCERHLWNLLSRVRSQACAMSESNLAIVAPGIKPYGTRGPHPASIRRLHQIHLAMFAQDCASLDITPVQYSILSVAAAQPGLEQARLSATKVGVDRTTPANARSPELEARGMLTRVQGVADPPAEARDT